MVTNAGFVHNIIPDVTHSECDDIVTVVLIIHPRFLEDVFPAYKDIYFTNEKEISNAKIRDIMLELSQYAKCKNHGEYEYLYMKGLLIQLLYYMCQEGIVRREAVDHVNTLKNIERIKGVIQFISGHYKEQISQTFVADKFYFSSVYFSRIFKKCTGMTFTEYLTGYRLLKAKESLLQSDKSISRIAMEHGFSDDRRFIIAFKQKYDITPLQYRKKHK